MRLLFTHRWWVAVSIPRALRWGTVLRVAGDWSQSLLAVTPFAYLESRQGVASAGISSATRGIFCANLNLSPRLHPRMHRRTVRCLRTERLLLLRMSLRAFDARERGRRGRRRRHRRLGSGVASERVRETREMHSYISLQYRRRRAEHQATSAHPRSVTRLRTSFSIHHLTPATAAGPAS